MVFLSKSKNLSKRYLWSFFVVVIIIDLVIAIMLFSLYSSIQTKTIAQHSVAQLNQVGTSTDILFDSLNAITRQMLADKDTLSFLTSIKTNYLQEASVSRKLKNLKITNPYIKYITLLNGETQRFVSNSYAGFFEQLNAELYYEKLGGEPYTCFLSQVGKAYNMQQSEKISVFSFVFSLGQGNLLVLDINESYFNLALRNIRIYNGKQEIILVDKHGQVISELTALPDVNHFNTTSSSKVLNIQEFVKSTKSAGFSLRFSDTKELQFLAFTKAPGAGWTIVNVLPYSIVLEGIVPLLLLTILLMIITLFFGYIISKKLSAALYAPIKDLYQNYVTPTSSNEKRSELESLSNAFSELYSKADRLEQGLISSYNESKNVYLRHLFTGDESKINTSIPIIEKLNINLSSPYYGTILIDCISNHLDNSLEKEQKNANLFICYYALENMTREIISSHCQLEFLRVTDSCFAVLLYLDNDEIPACIPDDMKTIISVMQEHLQMETTICIGNTVDSWGKIAVQYHKVYSTLHSCSAFHRGKIFYVTDKPDFINTGIYYNDLLSKISEYIREEDQQTCIKIFNNTLDSVQNISFKDAKIYIQHILMSVLDEFVLFFERDNEHFISFMIQIERIDRCQSVQAIKSVIETFLADFIYTISSIRKSSNLDVALKIQNFINENYSDPNISLKTLSDMVSLTPAYLGKIFTTVTTYSFNDYLNNVRTSKAAELLINTKLSIGEISEQVGILNTNYFYGLFKKRYGMTPAVYRKNNKLNDIE